MTAATVPRTTIDTLTRRESSELKTPPCPACVSPMWPMLDDAPVPRYDRGHRRFSFRATTAPVLAKSREGGRIPQFWGKRSSVSRG
jgi:hypothetical protein